MEQIKVYSWMGCAEDIRDRTGKKFNSFEDEDDFCLGCGEILKVPHYHVYDVEGAAPQGYCSERCMKVPA